MKQVLTFNVRIKGLENKIWRKIEILESDTLADLSYFILASFELYYNEFFAITFGNCRFDSASSLFDNDDYKSVMSISLNDINFDENKIMFLDYNFESKVTFVIEYVKSKKVTDGKYPRVIGGAGKGALEYVSGEELKKIVDETENNGYSSYTTTIVIDDVEEEEVFDYTDFDLEINDDLSRCNVDSLKDEYECVDLVNFIRIMRKDRVAFFKSDIKEIVTPYDYIKEYIPDNYEDLSLDEVKALNIPSYEDLHIYKLPQYKEIAHKNIMTLYVKEKVEDKDIRRDLFNALRNYDYMDKFYNNLRKHGLFKEYLDYSNYYYQQIIDAWKKEWNRNLM